MLIARMRGDLVRFFDHSQMNQIAAECGFLKRTSKLKPWMFVESLVLNSSSCKDTCLNDLSAVILDRYGVEISKQGIDSRFNAASVRMAKAVLDKAMADFSHVHLPAGAFAQFNSVRIKDSTAFGLPEPLAALFPGYGGGSSKAQARIQYEIDIKAHRTVGLELTAGTRNDYTDAWETKDDIAGGDLIIRDLGYSSLKMLESIARSEAYYLNRIKPDVAIFESVDGRYRRMDLAKLEQTMRQAGIEVMEKQVYLGERTYFPSRMIIALVPEPQIEERKAKQKRKSERRNSKASERCLSSLGLNLFATNADGALLPSSLAMLLYKIRWQIELIFKAWKSLGHIHSVKNAKADRVLTVLYLKLAWVFTNMHIVNAVSSVVFAQAKRKTSIYKAFKIIEKKRDTLWSIAGSKTKVAQWLGQAFHAIKKLGLSEKRKDRVNSIETLLLFAY
jgi:hypothetical protein